MIDETTKAAETEPQTGEQEYDQLLHAVGAAILLLDPSEGSILDCNSSAGSLYKNDRDELIGKPLQDLFVDAVDAPDLATILKRDAPERIESRHHGGTGHPMTVEMLLSPVTYRGRRVVLSVNREIKPHSVKDGPGVGKMLSILRATFDATADGILVLDPDARFVTSNRLFGEMWGIPTKLLQPGQEAKAVKIVLKQLEDPGVAVGRVLAIQANQKERSSDVISLNDGRHLECVSMPQLISGRNVGRVWSFRDITVRVEIEERVRHNAYHDSLTGLPNRALFKDRLSQELAQARRAKTNTALLLLDLDRFKTINDTLGHAAGDELLVDVADRLRSRKRDGDTIARLGGDEFVFIISQLRHKEDAAVVAEQILEVLKAPILIADFDLHVSASIGIALFPDDGDEGTALLKSADVALYRAKELGRNNYQIFEPKLNERAMERLVLEKDLRRAIHDREFVLQYQPQWDLKTGQMSGVEALVRWQQGDAIVPPDKFIPVAEECGLIVPIGRWVLEEAAKHCAEFNKHRKTPLRLCVNVSALQIQRPNFANEVSEILKAAGISVDQLVVELTESALMQNPEQGSWAMAQLRQMGIGIAMDDFGTGHSSLNHVSLLPISIIKIDRAFVRNCSVRKPDALILEAIVTMGHALGLKVLAEGVETHEQAEVLRKQGCDEVQGYLYGCPVSADQLLSMLKKQ